MKVHSSYCYSPLASSCFPASVCSSQPNRVSADCWHVTNTQLLHFGLWGATGMHQYIHAECCIRSVHLQRGKLRWIHAQIRTFSLEVNILAVDPQFVLSGEKQKHNFFHVFIFISVFFFTSGFHGRPLLPLVPRGAPWFAAPLGHHPHPLHFGLALGEYRRAVGTLLGAWRGFGGGHRLTRWAAGVIYCKQAHRQ